MSNCQQSDGDDLNYHAMRQGDRWSACFLHPCEMTVIVSEEALKDWDEKDLYELCLARLNRTLATVRLELAEYGDPGAFCVRWKK